MIKKADNSAHETLTELMRDTEQFAVRSMRDRGCITARLYIHGETGTQTLLMKTSDSVLKKRDFATFAKIACIAAGADATVFASEAWVLNAITGESPILPMETRKGKDEKEVIIESKIKPDANLFKQAQKPGLGFVEQVEVLQNRREVVILMGEILGYGEQRIMPIRRSEDGKFVCFGNTDKLVGNQFQGEFANFISKDCLDFNQRTVARQFLAKHGFNFESQIDQLRMRPEHGRGMQYGM